MNYDFFSDYNSVIYDANCIIYYCLRTELPSRKGTLIVIDSPPFTDITRNLTQYLIKRNIKIRTILIVFEEITKEVISLVIKQRINDGHLRKDLGLARGEKFPEDIEYNLNKNLRKKVKKMRYERWFELDERYSPSNSLLVEVRKYFEARRNAFGNKKIPSDEDMILILYSKDTVLPLISNDSHICKFKESLEKEGYTHKIIPLMDCTPENLN
jgi:hypothetical protein